MAKIKKFIILPALVLAAVLSLTGCFANFGGAAPNPTNPPEKAYNSVDDFKKAVAEAKANTAALDEENLKGLEYYYDLKAVPDGAKLNYIKVSAQAVRVSYTFGEVTDESFDNRIEIAWYRTVQTGKYLSDIVSRTAEYDSLKLNDIDYIHTTPDIQFIVTPAPGDTAAATPTPKTEKYCQFLYWVQDDAAFMAAVPLGFTSEDIGKYSVGAKVALD